MVALWTPHRAAADPIDDFSFDIYVEAGMVEVWVDINQLVSESNWDQLEDGADIAFELSFSLSTPRKFFGDSEVARNEQAIKLSYHIVTETYYCGSSINRFERPASFASVAELSDFLADSLSFTIAELDKLNRAKKHSLKITVTRVSIGALSRYTDESDSLAGNSPLEPLFHAFLDLTQFGRQEFQARSRLLSIDELTD